MVRKSSSCFYYSSKPFRFSASSAGAIAGSLISLFGAVISFNSKIDSRYTNSSLWVFVFIGLVIAAFFSPLKNFALSIIDWQDFAVSSLKIAVYWLIGSAITGFFFWVSFSRDVRKRFDKRFAIESQSINLGSARRKDLLAKAFAIGTYNDNIFLQRDFRLDSSPAQRISYKSSSIGYGPDYKEIYGEDNLDVLDAAIDQVLPPRIDQFWGVVTYAGIIWPVTLLSLIFGDLVRHVLDFLMSFWHKALDAASRAVFGELKKVS